MCLYRISCFLAFVPCNFFQRALNFWDINSLTCKLDCISQNCLSFRQLAPISSDKVEGLGLRESHGAAALASEWLIVSYWADSLIYECFQSIFLNQQFAHLPTPELTS